MSEYRTILIDDEPLALRRLEKLLSPFENEIDILAKIDNGPDAIRAIDELKPDLIFLDIQMPELNGFEVLEQIKHQPIVIFSTAYDEYALRAFETNSVDYLLKPVDASRLKKAIAKLKTFSSEQREDLQVKLQEVLLNMHRANKRIRVTKGDKIRLLPPEHIYFFTADEKYTRVSTYDNAYLIDKSLSSLESELSGNFVRIHRASIINLDHIDEIVRMFKGSFRVIMKDKNKSSLSVSRQLKHKLGL